VTLERAVVPASNASHEGATELGMIVGTPAYMSPEQCRGEPLSPRSDVYSLGVVSYRLLSGRLPFTGTSEELLTAHLARTPTPLATLCPKLPRDAAATVMRALAKSPQERPQTAGAFASMFTAGALSTGDFLESALMLYLEHFRPFLSAAIVGLSPMVALGLFAALNALGSVYGHPLVPRSAGPGLVGAVLLLTMAPGVLLVHGAVVPAVMQAVVAPLQPIDVASLGRRFRPRLLVYVRCVAPLLAFFVATAVWQVPAHWLARRLAAIEDSGGAAETATAVVIGLLPNLPLLVMLAFLARTGSARALQLIASVAVMEGLTVRQTIERASRLVASCPGPLRVARLAAMALAASLGLAGVGAFALLAQRLPPLVAYLRARRALGEPLDKALEEFERAVLPESHWKLAERERVATLIASRR
jgi:hypothetical protein